MDAVETPNHTHLWISSNEDWVVPAGPTARRFFCLNVPDTRRNDTAYFGAIEEQMVNGGYEALMHTLMTPRPLGLRHPPGAADRSPR